MSEFTTRLAWRLGDLVPLSQAQMQRLERHYEIMVRWNRRLNLTSVTELGDAVDLHYAESLFLASLLSAERWEVADFGSGAGFPGFPAAVLHPNWTMHLLEARHRKAAFLREACAEVATIKVIASEAQAVGRSFDLVLARAVDPHIVLNAGLAARFGLLLSTSDAARLVRDHPGLEWQLQEIPWNRDHAALIGITSGVPRET